MSLKAENNALKAECETVKSERDVLSDENKRLRAMLGLKEGEPIVEPKTGFRAPPPIQAPRGPTSFR